MSGRWFYIFILSVFCFLMFPIGAKATQVDLRNEVIEHRDQQRQQAQQRREAQEKQNAELLKRIEQQQKQQQQQREEQRRQEEQQQKQREEQRLQTLEAQRRKQAEEQKKQEEQRQLKADEQRKQEEQYQQRLDEQKRQAEEQRRQAEEKQRQREEEVAAANKKYQGMLDGPDSAKSKVDTNSGAPNNNAIPPESFYVPIIQAVAGAGQTGLPTTSSRTMGGGINPIIETPSQFDVEQQSGGAGLLPAYGLGHAPWNDVESLLTGEIVSYAANIDITGLVNAGLQPDALGRMSQLPQQNVTANYNGNMFGYEVESGHALAGGINMTVAFEGGMGEITNGSFSLGPQGQAATINGSIEGQLQNPNNGMFDLNMLIVDNPYLEGAMQGAFYGNNGQVPGGMAGTWAIRASGASDMVGGFRAPAGD